MATRKRFVARTVGRQWDVVGLPLLALPNDVIIVILEKVASQSLWSLRQLRRTCRELRVLAVHEAIYPVAATDQIPLMLEDQNHHARLFIKRCFDAGNLETIFYIGIVNFFWRGKDAFFGWTNLVRVARSGLRKAMYVCVMLSFINGRMHRAGVEPEMIRFWQTLREEKEIQVCRLQVQGIIMFLSIGLRHGVVQKSLASVCSKPDCDWSSMYYPGDVVTIMDEAPWNDGTICEECRLDIEMQWVCETIGFWPTWT
ncbi:uncharacterized protein LOC129302664 [Prosopis cineraria]|uniref:uncharacterized protein LOC129302664 n=1 Tax=Prosopis cineraria TaxID=364024 RepID=UPI002410299E|nr:uncharacterized protein LOC129302664 [Prosopis cineraria]